MVLKKKHYDAFYGIMKNLGNYKEISGIMKKFRQIFGFFFQFLNVFRMNN